MIWLHVVVCLNPGFKVGEHCRAPLLSSFYSPEAVLNRLKFLCYFSLLLKWENLEGVCSSQRYINNIFLKKMFRRDVICISFSVYETRVHELQSGSQTVGRIILS